MQQNSRGFIQFRSPQFTLSECLHCTSEHCNPKGVDISSGCSKDSIESAIADGNLHLILFAGRITESKCFHILLLGCIEPQTAKRPLSNFEENKQIRVSFSSSSKLIVTGSLSSKTPTFKTEESCFSK